MIIKEARKAYREYLQNLQEQRRVVSEAIKKKEESPDDTTVYQNKSGVILDLSEFSKELEKKEKEAQDYMGNLAEYAAGMENAEAAKENAKAMGKGMQDVGKCIEIAKRIAKGGRVPQGDEKKLMEFDDKLYQMAKMQGAMARRHKKYDTLWPDEEEGEAVDMKEMIDNLEAPSGGAPEIEMDTVSEVE